MFWNRKKTPPANLTEPRDHHYLFAHHAAREICLQDPLRFFGIFASPERDKFLAWLWTTVEKRVGKPIVDVDPRETAVVTTKLKDCPAIFIRMPVAMGPAEAHIVGVVLTEFPQEATAAPTAAVRYFTLEHGVRLDGSARTVLCEWADGAHRNYGDGPAATVADFAKAVEARI